MRRTFYVLTGGTVVHVAPHFSFAAPAYGSVGESVASLLRETLDSDIDVHLVRTAMALGGQRPTHAEESLLSAAGLPRLESNEDLARLLRHLVEDPQTAGIVMACAVADWEPVSVRGAGDVAPREAFGKSTSRFRTDGGDLSMVLRPAPKLLAELRRERKDIFVVGFKATTGMTADAQYIAGLDLLKRSSSNLVLANDVHTNLNMVVTPEEARYHVGTREAALRGLAEMIALRSGLTFTRSEVIDAPAIEWRDPEVAPSLRAVVDHCIARGAYKPFRGATVGHFATRGPRPELIYTSRRKSDFNRLADDGLIAIETSEGDRVRAYGGKPSVGGCSQRIIFDEHPQLDCIVHFHCPLRAGSQSVAVRSQRPYECGSHECGTNTSHGLREVRPGIWAVYLDNHGPNVAFARDADAAEVIRFIDEAFDLAGKTGGPVTLAQGHA